MARKEPQGDRYRRLKAEGLCTVCAKRPLVTGTRCQECRDKQVKAMDTWYYRDHEGRKTERREYSKTARANRRLRIIDLLGGCCARCGMNDVRILQIDHKDGGGSKETARVGWQSGLYKLVRENPEKYQLLCPNCNWIKRIENAAKGETGRRYLRHRRCPLCVKSP